MGLSLAVLVAIVIVLPGVSLVFAASKDRSTTGQPPLDTHISEGLALALFSAILLHALWYAAWCFICDAVGALRPEAEWVLALFNGDSKDAKLTAALHSVALYPLRIAAYFLGLTLLGYGAGHVLNHLFTKEGGALWAVLLPSSTMDLLWLTIDVELGGEAFLFAGYLRDYAVDKDAGLERVVLGGAICQPLTNRISSLPFTDGSSGPSLDRGAQGWTPVVGDLVVLQVRASRSITINVFRADSQADRPAQADEPRLA